MRYLLIFVEEVELRKILRRLSLVDSACFCCEEYCRSQFGFLTFGLNSLKRDHVGWGFAELSRRRRCAETTQEVEISRMRMFLK